MRSPDTKNPEPRIMGFSRNVFFLGLVSFLTDVSSEMIFPIMPLFLSSVLGAGAAVVGLIEGVGDSTASLLRFGSGWLSDRLGKRKSLASLGYGLSTAAKPFLYLANAWSQVLAVRFADRVGKGIRSAPRDALIADSVTPQERGKSFGLHKAMDTAGAAVGVALAAGIVFFSQRGHATLSRATYQNLVLVAVIPAVLAVLLLVIFVRERAKRTTDALHKTPSAGGSPGLFRGGFDRRFKVFLAIIALFTLGSSSSAFLMLRAQSLGAPVLNILLMLLLFNGIYAGVALPAGVLSDRLGRKGLIIVGWMVFALTYTGLALATCLWQIWLLFGVYGVYYGMAEGVSRALVADMVVVERRGTAYGWYHAVVGIIALPSSVIAGALWQMVSPAATFYFGAALAVVAALALLVFIRD